MHSLKLFATVPALRLEMGAWGDYDRRRTSHVAITSDGRPGFLAACRKEDFLLITGLDHVVVLTSDINAGSAAYQTLFARSPAWQNSGDGADRVLFTLDNMTLELMSPSGEGGAADRIRSVLAEQGEGLASLCFRTGDIGKMHRRLDRLTLKPEPVAEVESRDAISGATLSWKRTRAATDATSGVRMFFLEREKERPLSVRTAPAAITAMDHVVVSTADPERAAALYGARLGLDMALDRSHPDWGRLMFFRCGDLIVEVTHRPGKQADAGRDRPQDRLRGMCWRVADIDATHARLTAAGVDVSEVRTGRKPGTRVMTVRNGTCGVPTLLVQPSAQRQ
jgi:catechol 2,3-dioxygenase-like lactoylglutathione lyase family enzyme